MSPFLAIEAPKVSSRSRLLTIDGVALLTTSKAVIRELHLREGEVDDPSTLVARVGEIEPSLATRRAMALLAYRDRSRAEIAQSLSLDGYSSDVIDSLCHRLSRIGLIDDARFVENYVRMKEASGWGFDRIRRGLSNAGVDLEDVERLHPEAPADELVRALEVARRKPQHQRSDVPRIAAALARRGFSSDIAWSAARTVSAASDLSE